MPSRRFPKPWTVEPIPSGYRVIDANSIVLAHVCGQPDDAIAASDARLTNDEARRISKLIARLPELVEVERDRNKAGSRRKPPAAPLQASDDRRSHQGGEAAGGSLRQLPAGAAPLSQSRDPAATQAHAGAGGGQASRLQQVRRQEQRDVQSDLGEAGCQGRRRRALSGFQ